MFLGGESIVRHSCCVFTALREFLVEHKASSHNHNTTTNLLHNKSIVVTLLIAAEKRPK